MQIHTPRHIPLPRELGKITGIATTGTACLILNGLCTVYSIFILGYSFSFTVTESGEVFVWGYGILGKGPNVEHSVEPSPIPPTLFGRNEFNTDCRVVSVFGGLGQFAALTNAGDLYVWGRNRQGSLGLGHLNNQFFPIKVN